MLNLIRDTIVRIVTFGVLPHVKTYRVTVYFPDRQEVASVQRLNRRQYHERLGSLVKQFAYHCSIDGFKIEILDQRVGMWKFLESS